jgi:hypothetical protein
MSTYSSDEDELLVEAGFPARAQPALGNHVSVFVSSSPVEEDVRVDVGDADFFLSPDEADRLAAMLTRQAARVRNLGTH